MKHKRLAITTFLLLLSGLGSAQQRRKIIIDQDCSGPGGSNLQAVLTLLQAPQVDVLGIVVVTGDQWREEEVARMLRLLEIIGRTDIPVLRGSAYPLVHRRDEAEIWQQRYGKVAYEGAWDERWWHEAFVIPTLAEGHPTTKPGEEDGSHFILRMVRQFPGHVSIFAGGPMTDLALAISIDPQFPQLVQELVFMGGSIAPDTRDPEFVDDPRHEFNFWFDPEAAEIVLRAPWRRIVCTPTDISIKTKLTPAMVKQIDSSGTPLAHYVARFFQPGLGADYMWDELTAAAWIDPTLITKRETRYLGVNLDRGAGYGNTLSWSAPETSRPSAPPVEIQVDLDKEKFYRMFVSLMSAPTPQAR